jgi:hypothetical protein
VALFNALRVTNLYLYMHDRIMLVFELCGYATDDKTFSLTNTHNMIQAHINFTNIMKDKVKTIIEPSTQSRNAIQRRRDI